MLWPPKLKAPRAATPGPGLSSRSRASYGLWLTYSSSPLSAGTPAGAVQRCPTLKAFQSQCRGQRFPGLRFGSRDTRHELHDRGALAAEVREIDPQGAEEAGPAGFSAFKLVVPVVRAGEEAIHHTDEAHTTRARFDAPLGCDGRRPAPALALPGKHPRRIPGRYGGTGLHARAEVHRHRDRLPVLFLELRRHEP